MLPDPCFRLAVIPVKAGIQPILSGSPGLAHARPRMTPTGIETQVSNRSLLPPRQENLPRRQILPRIRNRADMLRRRAAATADDVHEAVLGEVADQSRRCLTGL